MNLFDWITAGIVIITILYISIVQTVGEWMSALRKGQAVSLLPERGAIVLLGLVIFVLLVYFAWIPLFVIPKAIAWIFDILGLALYLAGFFFVEWARWTIGKYWGLSTSLQVKLLDEHQLVQAGPYAFVRHPMYFGAWILFLGLTMLYPVWVMAVLFLSTLVAFTGRARREEAALSERFGEEWNQYARHTRFLIPFLY